MYKTIIRFFIFFALTIVANAQIVTLSNNYWKISLTPDGQDGHPAGSLVELVDYKYGLNNWVGSGPFLAPHLFDINPINGEASKTGSSIVFKSRSMRSYQGQEIPLSSEITYSLDGPILKMHFRFTANGNIDETRSIEALSEFSYDGIDGYTNGIHDFSFNSMEEMLFIRKYAYLNQVFIIHGDYSDLELICPKPYDSSLVAVHSPEKWNKLCLLFLVSDDIDSETPGDPYHSVLTPGMVIDREYYLLALPAKSNYESLHQPLVYLSPHPDKSDQSVIFMWDELPVPHPDGGDWALSYDENGDNVYINGIIDLLNKHPRARVVLLLVLDGIWSENQGSVVNEGDYYGWAGYHGNNRIKNHAPPEYLQWLKDIQNHNPSYPWMLQADLALHAYHHTQSMQELVEHEFEITGYERAEALFHVTYDDLQSIQLDAQRAMSGIRFAGFQYTQDALEAAAKWGVRFYDNMKEFEHFRFTRKMFVDGEMLGVNTCWWADFSGEMPDHGRPLSYISYILDKGKIALLGGHPEVSLIPGEPLSYERMERALDLIDGYQYLSWVFPSELVGTFDRQKAINSFQMHYYADHLALTYFGGLLPSDTLVIDRINEEQVNGVTIDGIKPTDYQYREGRMYINHCPTGNLTHTINIPYQFTESKPIALSYKAYPNPSSGIVNFRLEGVTQGTIKAHIYDIAGELVDDGADWNWQSINSSTKESTQDYKWLASGVYFIHLEVRIGERNTQFCGKFAVIH